MNRVTINFIECDPMPSKGYYLQWRVLGSGNPYTSGGNFFSSPIVFNDDINLPGTEYEGTLTAQLKSGFCNSIAWSTAEDSGGSGSGGSGTMSTLSLTQFGACSINSYYLLEGATAGDIVVVESKFNGVLSKLGGLFTRADLSILCVDGTSDSLSSSCYSDNLFHAFSITVQTTIVMPGPTTVINTVAVVHNSSDSPTGNNLKIVSRNGIPEDVIISGCKGNSATGGTC